MKQVARSSTRAASEVRVRARSLPRTVVRLTLLLLAPAWVAASARTAAASPKEVCIAAATDGQRTRDDGRWLEAKEQFLTCAAATCPGLVRAECARWLSDLDAKIPSVVLGAKDASGVDLTAVRVLLDGKPYVNALDGRPRQLDPGAHRLRFVGEGDLAANVDVVIRAGESARVVVAVLEPESGISGARATTAAPPASMSSASSSPPSTRDSSAPRSSYAAPMWILGGLAVTSAGAATALVVYAHDENDALSSSCSPRCTDARTSELRTSLAFANVAAVATLLSLGGLTYLIVKSATAPTTIAVVPSLSPQGAGASATLRY
jgi:hypothetical protein